MSPPASRLPSSSIAASAGLLFLIACGTDAGTEPSPDAAIPIGPPVACGMALPGPAMSTVESEPGYAQQRAALDLSIVRDPYDFGGEIGLTRGLVNYMLGRDGGTTFTRADIEAAGPLGDAVLAAVAITGGKSIDLTFLRRGLYHGYNCSSLFPPTLDALYARYGDYGQWITVQQDCAPPKDLPRRVMMNHDKGVYVAETLDAGQVREVEVLFTQLRTGGIDFAVYTGDGKLTDRSMFATVGGTHIVGAAPFTCMTCHVDRASWTFTVHRPVGTGAGCR